MQGVRQGARGVAAPSTSLVGQRCLGPLQMLKHGVNMRAAIAMRPPQVVTAEKPARTAETEQVAPAPKKEKAVLQRAPVRAEATVPPPKNLRNLVFVTSEVGGFGYRHAVGYEGSGKEPFCEPVKCRVLNRTHQMVLLWLLLTLSWLTLLACLCAGCSMVEDRWPG